MQARVMMNKNQGGIRYQTYVISEEQLVNTKIMKNIVMKGQRIN